MINTIKGPLGYSALRLASLDKTHLAVCYWSGYLNLGNTIQILNWKTGGEFGKKIDDTKEVNALAKLEEEFLASASRYIKIWHWTSGRIVINISSEHRILERIFVLLPIKNNTQIVSSGYGIKIKVWDRTNGELIKTLVGHLEWVKSLILLSNGLLASGSGDATIGIWNLTNGIQVRRLTGHSGEIQSLTNLGPSRKASGDRDWKIKIWSVNSGKEIKTLSGHSDWVISIVLMPNGHLFSASGDKSIQIWDLDKNSSLIKILFAHLNGVTFLSVLIDGILASVSYETIKIWHFERNSTNYSGKLINYH